MAMKRCPDCGERYSDTYKDCPFCEEEEALQDGEEIRRPRSRGGHRAASRQQMNLITPTLVVLIIIMASLLVYLLWGDKIAEKFHALKEPAAPPTEEVQPNPTEDPAGQPAEDPAGQPTENPGVMPDDPNAVVPSGGDESGAQETDYETIAKLPDGLKLSTTDFTLRNLGETHVITVSGGGGNYRWASEDEGIASVDSSGKVTAVSGGTTNVVVSDGSKKGVCIVRVTASGKLPSVPPATESGSGGAHTLNREDMTLSNGESFQLKLTGVTTALTWSSSNSAVAAVSGNGTVTAASSGTTTVTVSWDGGSCSCVVRVK